MTEQHRETVWVVRRWLGEFAWMSLRAYYTMWHGPLVGERRARAFPAP